MTVPPDYNAQLQAHLQAWRQLLDSLAALAATVPNLGPNLGPNPGPNPAAPLGFPPPPPPADPTHQLFGYLKAWRNYLEESAGAVSREPARQESPSTENGSAHTDSRPRRAEPVPPADPGASRASKSSASPWPPNRPLPKAPADEYGGQVYGLAPLTRDATKADAQSGRDKQAAVVARGERIARPPAMEAAEPVAPNLSAVTEQFRGLARRAGIE